MKSELRLAAVTTLLAAFICLTGSSRPVTAFGRTSFTSFTSIHQEIELDASPKRVYQALLDSKQFSQFSGLPADIKPEAGGAFTCFDGVIVGRNVELIPNQRIVQAWRSNGWPKGAYSIVKFDLKEHGSGTLLSMDHNGFPEGEKDSLDAGWKSHYWEPLQKFFVNRR